MKYKKTMKRTPQEIEQIILDTCGNPPKKAKLEYRIWLNTYQLEFYGKQTTDKRVAKTEEEHKEMLETLMDLIGCASGYLQKYLVQTGGLHICPYCANSEARIADHFAHIEKEHPGKTKFSN